MCFAVVVGGKLQLSVRRVAPRRAGADDQPPEQKKKKKNLDFSFRADSFKADTLGKVSVRPRARRSSA